MIDEKVNGNGKPPAIADLRRVSLPLPAPPRELEPAEPAVPLSQYLWILKRHRWKILGAVATCVIGTAIVSARLTPIYEATATIDIDRSVPTGILGQEAIQSATNDADQFIATQMKLIQSDSVLRPVDRQYNLRRREAGETDSAALRTAEAEGAPVVLKKLKVTRPPNTYLLLVKYRSPDRQEAADVANATVRSYLEHTYRIRYQAAADLSQFMERQLEELRAKMERSSGALAKFERDLNVINPEERTNIVSARLLQLNTEYTTAEAERVKRETAFNSVKLGTLAAAQVSSQGADLQKLTETLNESRRRFVDAMLWQPLRDTAFIVGGFVGSGQPTAKPRPWVSHRFRSPAAIHWRGARNSTPSSIQEMSPSDPLHWPWTTCPVGHWVLDVRAPGPQGT